VAIISCDNVNIDEIVARQDTVAFLVSPNQSDIGKTFVRHSSIILSDVP
jgi:hypothetical protein